ncbi:Lrp/AsnC family transcriptional regulator [Halocynthiibacter sp.]|uniref:Lrp/AsnC family transcriptional regulator n=1 Tax=Halocynthiibacter sp. TaxID=1979210 RepID=UPI003C5BAD35
MDRTDQAILNELSENARIPVAELSKKVNLSRNALRNRLSKLEADSIIKKYTIERGAPGPNDTGTIGIIMIDRRDRMRGADVTSALKKIPEVKTCFVLSGRFDLIVQVEVESAERLKQICAEIWDLPGVQDTRTYFALSTIIDRR